ncbi:hypothetical protein B0H10DRAFT_40391 [Mycena sp. CBHHK59/15]|nr:hypothetical protein B0H10DRAFT_40391 [Mycena sp. CBHHK59/15]
MTYTSLKLPAALGVVEFLGIDLCQEPIDSIITAGWELSDTQPTIVDDGWTRFQVSSDDLEEACATLSVSCGSTSAWVTQANYIWHQVDADAGLETSRYLGWIEYSITFKLQGSSVLDGAYLFLCPIQDLYDIGSGLFRMPDCAAFFSYNPSGTERLASDSNGFPDIQVSVLGTHASWPMEIYDNVRNFHANKGFDPYSQDVARRLGYPLYIIPDKIKRKSRMEKTTPFSDPSCTEGDTPWEAKSDAEISLRFPKHNAVAIPSPNFRIQAITRAQELETSWMNDDDLLTLIDLFEQDAVAAEVYNSMTLEHLRVKWVQRKLGLL